jgi:hypothetical protein
MGPSHASIREVMLLSTGAVTERQALGRVKAEAKKKPGNQITLPGLFRGDWSQIAIKIASTTTNYSKGDFERNLQVSRGCDPVPL